MVEVKELNFAHFLIVDTTFFFFLRHLRPFKSTYILHLCPLRPFFFIQGWLSYLITLFTEHHYFLKWERTMDLQGSEVQFELLSFVVKRIKQQRMIQKVNWGEKSKFKVETLIFSVTVTECQVLFPILGIKWILFQFSFRKHVLSCTILAFCNRN